MDSKSPPKLPVIDFGKEDLKPGTVSWKIITEEVRKALEEYGCFVAALDQRPRALHDSLLEPLKELFDLPPETKSLKNAAAAGLGVCYYEPSPSAPLVESFTFENPKTIEATRRFIRLFWSDVKDEFCETSFKFSKLLGELAEMVLRMVSESYGLEELYNSHVTSSTVNLMGFAKLQAPPQEDGVIDKVGQSHTDTSFFTIIYQNLVESLELKTKDGDWIAFEPEPSHLLFMAGDAFVAWSNGRIHAPPHVHGVTSHGKEASYSAFFISSVAD